MELLWESKSKWLAPYCVCALVLGIMFYIKPNNVGWKTVEIILCTEQIIILIEFFLILITRWRIGCRTVATLALIISVVVEGVKGSIHKWYVIIFMLVACEIYMWRLISGIKNCMVVSEYKPYMDEAVKRGKKSYKEYSYGIDEYNSTEGFWGKVKKRKEPDWDKFDKIHGNELFGFNGGLRKDEFIAGKSRIDEINGNITRKNWFLGEDKKLVNEKTTLKRVIDKDKLIVGENSCLSRQEKKMNRQHRNVRKALKKDLKKEI